MRIYSNRIIVSITREDIDKFCLILSKSQKRKSLFAFLEIYIISYNRFFLRKIIIKIIAMIKESPIMIIKEYGSVPKLPNETFMPKNEAIMVGIEITNVIEVKNFIISFKLFEIIEL